MGRFATAAAAVMLGCGVLALAGCTPPPIRVTTTVDLVADDGRTSLREAFLLANRTDSDDTIVLAADRTYFLNDCGRGPLVHSTPSALTVEGRNAFIRQTCADTTLLRATAPTSSLDVRAVTLVGTPGSGANLFGAAIDVRGALVLAGTVTGFDAGPGGTVIEGNVGGPAPVDLTLRGRITDNTGTAVHLRDGVVRLEGMIERSVGDGIRVDGFSHVDLEPGSLIAENSGWGIRSDGSGAGRLTGDEALIGSNGSGGVRCEGCAVVELTGSVLFANGSLEPGEGGGLVMLLHQDDPSDAPRVHLVDTRFEFNGGPHPGGAVFVGPAVSTAPDAPATDVVLDRVSFQGNVAFGDSGGAVAVTSGDLTLRDSVFEFNGAADGGAVHFAEAAEDGITEPYDFDSSNTVYFLNEASGRGGGAFVETEGRIEIRSDAFTANRSGADGGGLHVRGAGDIRTSSFSDNVAGGRGGGAHLEMDGAVRSSRFQGNQATDGGGALFRTSDTGDLTVWSSTFADNVASGQGGGAAGGGPRRLDLVNVTVTGNRAGTGGGFATSDGPARLTHVTFAANGAPVGANLAGGPGLLELFASVVVEAHEGDSDCSAGPGGLVSLGLSFLSDASCGAHPTDTVSADDPQLGPLADNGGDTPTRLPAPTSPIGGLVPVPACTTAADQRSVSRPLGPACEPGAVEISEATGEAP